MISTKENYYYVLNEQGILILGNVCESARALENYSIWKPFEASDFSEVEL